MPTTCQFDKSNLLQSKFIGPFYNLKNLNFGHQCSISTQWAVFITWYCGRETLWWFANDLPMMLWVICLLSFIIFENGCKRSNLRGKIVERELSFHSKVGPKGALRNRNSLFNGAIQFSGDAFSMRCVLILTQDSWEHLKTSANIWEPESKRENNFKRVWLLLFFFI